MRPASVHRLASDAVSVRLGHGKNDCLAWKLSRLVFEADFHNLFPLLAQGVFIADLNFNFRAFIVEVVRFNALLN